MNANWKQDSRLKDMDPQKLALLNEFARQVESTPKNQLMTTLLTLNMQAQQKGLHFSDQETELMVSIMTAGMSPAERKRVETLRMVSQSLSKKK